MQRHFLNLGTPLSGCRLTAADVNGDTLINSVDVIAIQRFFLGQTTGIANVGKYQFSPVNRTYLGVVSGQTGQNYDALVFGDVASGFVNRPEDPSQPGAKDGTSAREIAATVAALSLPEVAMAQSKSNVIAEVKTTEIDASNKLIGFQGDLTFDERVVSFQDFTPLSGSGTLFSLNMTRVSPGAQSTKLIWAAPPDQFIFIDADLNTQRAGNAASGGVTTSRKRK